MNSEKIDHAEIDCLVEEARAGSSEAFGEIYDRLIVSIYRYVYYRVPAADAEDLTELAFLKAWKNLVKYKKQKGANFTSWLYRIAHNVIVDFHRANARENVVELPEDMTTNRREENPEEAVESNFENAELSSAIRSLPEIQQQVIVLKFINELGNEEIAKIIEKSEGSVRIIQFRALARLRELLGDEKFAKSVKISNKETIFEFKTTESA